MDVPKIAYIQPIFVPSEYQYKKNKESLLSFFNYIKKYNIDNVHIYIGGWGKFEYMEKIIDFVQEYNIKVETISIFNKNFGKAYVVNKLFTKIKNDETYILTSDSDIIYNINEEHIFSRLIECSNRCKNIKNKQTGIVALNQTGDSRHIYDKLTKSDTYINQYDDEEEIIYYDGPSHIAGGSIFLPTDVFKHVNGYKEMGVYAGDDAYLFLDVYRLGYSIQVLKTLTVIHPMSVEDKEYEEWKLRTLHKHDKNSILDTNKVDEAEKIWRNN